MKNFFTKTKIIIGVVGLVVIGGVTAAVVNNNNKPLDVLTDIVKKQDITQTVLATGQVSSTTDLDLAFKASGVVQSIKVKVGSSVVEGDILANLDQRDQIAGVTQARASVSQAQANLQKVLAGASSPDVQVSKAAVTAAEIALINAQKSRDASVNSAEVALINAQSSLSETQAQQTVAVASARSSMLNAGLAAFSNSNTTTATLAVSGTYTGAVEGEYMVKLQSTGNGLAYQVTGLGSGGGTLNRGLPQSLGSGGLFLTISNTGSLSSFSSWSVPVPNKQSSLYISAENGYQSALQTQSASLAAAQSGIDSAQSALVQAATVGDNAVASAQSALDQANATLALKQANARPEDVAVARAGVTAAQAQLAAASAVLESTVVRAPASGTVTAINLKVGEQANPALPIITLQDVTSLNVEANISEANIAQINLDQKVSFTFDALGPDREFNGRVQFIDPASTVVSGVVNYKITALVDELDEIKPGMTANMIIGTAEKKDVLAIPQRAVISKKGEKFVRMVIDPVKKTFEEKKIVTGIDADDGLVEVVSGLQAGEEIVTFVNEQ